MFWITSISRLLAITAATTFIFAGTSFATDCNGNGIEDTTEISAGSSLDCQGNGIPDECDPAMDFDGDWDIDTADYLVFEACFTGPCVTPPCVPALYADSCCARADFDRDGDVDLDDYGFYQQKFPPQGERILIAEFMASNDKSLVDEDGDHSDWLELRNSGTSTVDLGGWYLTDDESDLTKWQFPNTTLPGGSDLIVFASEKDRAISGEELHTNFKLKAAGEYLALVRPDGVTIEFEYAPDFPEQLTDTSYGLSHSLINREARYFVTPTPGATNNNGFSGFANTPEFSHAPGTFITPFALSMFADSPTAEIRYTLDGTEPNLTNGQTYQGSPIYVSDTTRIRARVFIPGFVPSPLVSQLYIAIDTHLQDFNSNMPLIVLDTRSNPIPCIGPSCQDSDYILTDAVFIDTGDNDRAAITDPADYAGRGGIKIRGNSSTMFPKKQFSFETWDEYDEDMDTSLLGFAEESDWIIHAPYSDKSLMRNVLAYKWSNDIGRWTVQTRYAEVFINEDGGKITSGDYRGVYIFMEKIKQGKDRVDIAKLEPDDNSEPEITGGYIIRKDRLDEGETGLYTQMLGELAFFDPKEDELTEQQKAWITNYIAEFETALQSPDFADPINGYARYIDVDSFIDHHIMVEMAKNVDGYRLSTYMNIDRNGKLKMGPIWDYNLSMGNADYSEWWIYTYQQATLWYYDQGQMEHAWYDRLMQDPEYNLRYADRWFELREDKFSNENLAADFSDTYDYLTEAAARNFSRWNILNQWVWPNWYYGTPSDPHTYQMEVDWTMRWLTGYDLSGSQTAPGNYSNRLAWADDNLGVSKPPIYNTDGGAVETNFVVEISKPTGAAGTIYYTLDGTDPRIGNGDPLILVTEDSELKATIPSAEIPGWNTTGFDDSGWTSGTGGVGYENNPGDSVNYTSFINLDVSSMHNSNSTCYIRIPFEITAQELSQLTSLALSIRHDDAFVAYINGTEVARSEFAPAALTYNASATNYREDGLCVSFDQYDVSPYIGLLNSGSANVLAIHGLNSSAGSSDFLISAQLGVNSIGGDISPTALDYSVTGPVTLTENTQIKARILDGAQWSALNKAIFAVGPQPLFINEFMADNDETIEDPDEPGAFDDWIEIYNPGVLEIDLGGMYLTDDLTEPTQWQIPAGVTIPASGYLVFWADDQVEQGNTHTNFKLGKGGEEIGLFASDADGNALVDSIVFGEQTTDVSYGRNPDGSNTWTTFTTATPGAANDSP